MNNLKRCGHCQAMKTRDAFAKRRASADGLCATCRVCANTRSAQWKRDHPGAYAKWYSENKSHKQTQWALWREANAEHHRANYKRWAKANPHKINALIAKRNAMKVHATPTWANPHAIRAIYRTAAELTRTTGIRHEVDHVVPLRSRVVCGLHVEANLQILTSHQNKKKTNTFTPLGVLPPQTSSEQHP